LKKKKERNARPKKKNVDRARARVFCDLHVELLSVSRVFCAHVVFIHIYIYTHLAAG
jgi:hypothetical protein